MIPSRPRAGRLTRIWSSTSTSTALFLPFTASLPSGSVGAARMAVVLRSLYGPIQVLPAFVRFTDPGAAWPAALALPASQSPTWIDSEGLSPMDEFRDLQALLAGTSFVVFGLWVRLASGSDRAFAQAEIRLELVPRAP